MEIPKFTGIFSPDEEPLNPNTKIDTSNFPIEEATKYVVKRIMGNLD